MSDMNKMYLNLIQPISQLFPLFFLTHYVQLMLSILGGH